jgi:hypothetical protein
MNYLVRKFENRDAPGVPYRGEQFYEVIRFSEVRPGIFFPTETRFVTKPDRSVSDSSDDVVTVYLTDVQINSPLPAATFQPVIPPKSHVLDNIEYITYTMGPNGEKLNVEANTTSLPPSLADQQAFPPQEPTTEEPKSWTRWILPASLLSLFLIGIITWRRQRLRSR